MRCRCRLTGRELLAERWHPGLKLEGVTVNGGAEGLVETPFGLKRIRAGDWLLTGAWGDHDVCSGSRFGLLYEVMDGA